MATVVDGVTIKKEIEDPESPDGQDSGQGQSENQNGQKSAKVWADDEIRSLIELAKVYIPNFKDSSYSKKQLLDDISNEMCLMGFSVTPENVRNKLKYLRSKYRSILHYNAKHATKRAMPFHQALHELYSLDYFNDQDLLEQNGFEVTPMTTTKRIPKAKPVPASHVDLRTVVTSKKRKPLQVKFGSARKKVKGGGQQPMFQCGLCMEKFKTSHDMHDHACRNVKGCEDVVKSVPAPSSAAVSAPVQANGVFHWNSLVTMHLLELLKEYQDSHKCSNFRKGNIWDNMSALMQHRGHTISPKEIEKKWVVLSTAFEKTLQYNRTHKDKKKCAFFKRLSDLHQHPSSFACFKGERMTVEVSPFSIAASSKELNTPKKISNVAEDSKVQGGSMPELMLWLENTWSEFRELERKREAAAAQRHHEMMEMLSYLVESKMDS